MLMTLHLIWYHLISIDIICNHDNIVVYHRLPSSSTRSKGCSSQSTWQTRHRWVRCWLSWQEFQWTSTRLLNQSFVPSGTHTAATLGSAGHLAMAMAYPVRLPTISPSKSGTDGVSSNSWESLGSRSPPRLWSTRRCHRSWDETVGIYHLISSHIISYHFISSHIFIYLTVFDESRSQYRACLPYCAWMSYLFRGLLRLNTGLRRWLHSMLRSASTRMQMPHRRTCWPVKGSKLTGRLHQGSSRSEYHLISWYIMRYHELTDNIIFVSCDITATSRASTGKRPRALKRTLTSWLASVKLLSASRGSNLGRNPPWSAARRIHSSSYVSARAAARLAFALTSLQSRTAG